MTDAIKEVVLDVETTGLDPKEGHRIVEIGAIKLENKLPTKEIFHYYINPERDMPQVAYNIHGISAEFLKDKPIFKTIADEFWNFVKGSRLIIHNAPFDLKFLNYELSLCAKPSINSFEVIDTLLLARKLYPGKKASLDALCTKFKVDISHRQFHGALKDSELLAFVYFHLTGGNNQRTLLHKEEQSMARLKKEALNYKIKLQQPTSSELENHKEMVNKIENAIWSRVL